MRQLAAEGRAKFGEDAEGGGTRIARSRYAVLYTIGYEVAVTCSWPADDVTYSVTRASIDYIGGSPDIGRSISPSEYFGTERLWRRELGDVPSSTRYNVLEQD